MWNKIKLFFKKWKIIDTCKYQILPKDAHYFLLSEQEYRDSERIYKEKGTITYTFSPSGIGWCITVTTKDGKEYNITDVTSW